MKLRIGLLKSWILMVGSFCVLYFSCQYLYPTQPGDLKAKETRQGNWSTPSENSELPSDFKYILTWTKPPKNIPLHGWAYPGLHGFQEAGCEEFRCYLTNNRSFLGNVRNIVRCRNILLDNLSLPGNNGSDKFSAIIFNQKNFFRSRDEPQGRHPAQYYIHW